MAKYNEKTPKVINSTTTHQGGQGFTQTPEKELIGMLSTGMVNTYYEKENEREQRFREVISKVVKKNLLFAVKALIYARTVFGQRSVTHYGAVEMIPYLSGSSFAKKFFSKRNRKENKGGIIYRLDDMTEILALYFAKHGDNSPIPNAIKRGFKDAIENADAYELAKYQMKGNKVSLVDIVNLVHPSETKKQGYVTIPSNEYIKAIKGTKWEKNITEFDKTVTISTLHALVLGILKQFNTVEDKNTKSGQEIAKKIKEGEITNEEAKIELNEAKVENFVELIETKKIGYLALLRNLRNIINTGNNDLIDNACKLLVNEEFIRNSLVWPHQIDLAMEVMILGFSGKNLQKITAALGKAYEKSIPNLNELLPYGKNAVVFDTSGSMQSNYVQVSINVGGKKQGICSQPVNKAALIAATFTKGTNCDVYHFGTECKRIVGFNPNDSINTLKKYFESHIGQCGHGTYYASILPTLSKHNVYDRVIIITDEQGADSFETSYKEYSIKYGTPYVYFVNICGYGPTMAKEGSKIHRIYGYSADIYEAIKRFEINIDEVMVEINKIEI